MLPYVITVNMLKLCSSARDHATLAVATTKCMDTALMQSHVQPLCRPRFTTAKSGSKCMGSCMTRSRNMSDGKPLTLPAGSPLLCAFAGLVLYLQI